MLYVLRHGRTDWNELKKLQGNVDVPLNATGIAMAKEAHELYKDVHFDVCYCSPLSRAGDTAQILLEGRNVPILYDDRLIEMLFGPYEGEVYDFEHPQGPIKDFLEHPEDYHPTNGAETFEQLYARIGEFLREVVAPELVAGKDVLVVAHGALNCAIICQLQNIPLKDFWTVGIPNCKLISVGSDEEILKRIF